MQSVSACERVSKCQKSFKAFKTMKKAFKKRFYQMVRAPQNGRRVGGLRKSPPCTPLVTSLRTRSPWYLPLTIRFLALDNVGGNSYKSSSSSSGSEGYSESVFKRRRSSFNLGVLPVHLHCSCWCVFGQSTCTEEIGWKNAKTVGREQNWTQRIESLREKTKGKTPLNNFNQLEQWDQHAVSIIWEKPIFCQ